MDAANAALPPLLRCRPRGEAGRPGVCGGADAPRRPGGSGAPLATLLRGGWAGSGRWAQAQAGGWVQAQAGGQAGKTRSYLSSCAVLLPSAPPSPPYYLALPPAAPTPCVPQVVRDDPMAWNETGDEYAQRPGMKPWISEMCEHAALLTTLGLMDGTAHALLSVACWGCMGLCSGRVMWNMVPPPPCSHYRRRVICRLPACLRPILFRLPADGYSFGCATAGVWHRLDHAAMLYPGYQPIGASWLLMWQFSFAQPYLALHRSCPMPVLACQPAPLASQAPPACLPASTSSPSRCADKPMVLHFGRLFEIGAYRWQKHWFFGFKALLCPPWPHMSLPMTGKEAAPGVMGGLFPHPLHPSTFADQVRLGGVTCGTCSELLGQSCVSARPVSPAARPADALVPPLPPLLCTLACSHQRSSTNSFSPSVSLPPSTPPCASATWSTAQPPPSCRSSAAG